MTKINHSKHIALIHSEFLYQTNEFKKLLKKQAAKMFVDNQLYICRYQGFDEVRGNIIVKFNHKICFPPRKNENLQCIISTINDENVKKWGGLTYEDLKTKIFGQFESKTVFFNYAHNHTVVGLSGAKAEDIPKFEKGALVFLAPTDPPLEYLFNLYNFLIGTNPENDPILDIQIGKPKWNPLPLSLSDSTILDIQTDLIEKDIMVIQGPAGTGKTTLMAKICKKLLDGKFNVLVTALTNRALVELAEKEHLYDALTQGKVFKSSLTADESKKKKLKGIMPFKSLSQQKPPLLLSTYYVMSIIAAKAIEDNHFDYVIIEEASQAFLSTIALARKLGKKCIIIGDLKQLEPIFQKEYAPEDESNYHWMICGLKSISYYLPNTNQFILTDSYRLPPNAVEASNAFYNGLLRSKSPISFPLTFEHKLLEEAFNNFGGPTIKYFELPDGKIPSIGCNNYIFKLIDCLTDHDPEWEIAVLTFYRHTVKYLQKEIFSKCKRTKNTIVETIDRVQGLTTDFCIFFIPLESIPFSLNANRFNVATSRARYCTLIITDKAINHFIEVSSEVGEYLRVAKETK